jgi:hypothetical protein
VKPAIMRSFFARNRTMMNEATAKLMKGSTATPPKRAASDTPPWIDPPWSTDATSAITRRPMPKRRPATQKSSDVR